MSFLLYLLLAWQAPLEAPSIELVSAAGNPTDLKAASWVQTSPLPAGYLASLRQADSESLSKQLRLYVVKEGERIDRDQSVSGNVELHNGRLLFKPKYPLMDGLTYEAELHGVAEKGPIRVRLKIPKKERKSSVHVQNIYPSSDRLPQNLLRIYVQFSAPVSRGDVYRYIELSTSDGKKLDYPFLELAEELWDTSGTRLTLLLDPARIKQGLVPREEDGPILEVGKSYQLVIRSEWPDSEGMPLVSNTIKKFEVIREDIAQPKLDQWKIHSPAPNSVSPLTIEFPDSLDYPLAVRCITLWDSLGNRVDGDVSLTDHETRWTLKPRQFKWLAGEYEIRVQTILEDLAGNSVARPFEVHLNESTGTGKANDLVDAAVESKVVTRRIVIGSAQSR